MATKTRRGRRSSRNETVAYSDIIDLTEYQQTKKKETKISPRNSNQVTFFEYLENQQVNIVFAIGPAGCGKTLLATHYAIKALKEKSISKIIISRPNVSVDDRDIGHLPGTILEKMMPWMKPIIDVFEEYYLPKDIISLIENGIIELAPIAFMRGRTFKDAIVIIDEAQGTTEDSMKAILTRIGDNSKMIITGDLEQSDLGYHNGLKDFITKFEKVGCNSTRIKMVKFTQQDVERHPVIKEILDLYS